MGVGLKLYESNQNGSKGYTCIVLPERVPESARECPRVPEVA